MSLSKELNLSFDCFGVVDVVSSYSFLFENGIAGLSSFGFVCLNRLDEKT
jgi:hypothetical protein